MTSHLHRLEALVLALLLVPALLLERLLAYIAGPRQASHRGAAVFADSAARALPVVITPAAPPDPDPVAPAPAGPSAARPRKRRATPLVKTNSASAPAAAATTPRTRARSRRAAA
jgi:hypothetical protein